MKTPAAPQNIESKSNSQRQPQYTWEMTLEQFQQKYFPELCREQKTRNVAEVTERKAA